MKVVGITLETNHLNIHSNEMLLFTIVCVNVITEKRKNKTKIDRIVITMYFDNFTCMLCILTLFLL